MVIFEAILVMLAAAMLLMMVARQLRLPYPVLLAIAGAVVAVLPVEVAFDIDPELVLALFVAPVLLDAAYDTSLRDLRRNWLPVASLALIAVGLTTAAVAAVVHILVPTIPWAAAIAIGAIVAPPDAVAATTVLRDVKLPHRITVVLEGEALLNDASTLVIYRLAVAAAVGGGSIGADAVAPAFLLSLVGSLVAGPAFAWIWGRLARRIEDMPSSVILQFVGTFGVWVGAEWLSLSPVLTVVAYGITLARMRAAYFPARLRLPSYAVWETSVVVLNVLAFLLIGLELAPVLASARPGELGHWFTIGGAVLLTVIVVRLVWTCFAAVLHRRGIEQGSAAPVDGGAPNWRTGLVIGWAGSRGIVTVATALALPAAFPERGMLLFAAFMVTLGTLVIQGLTLRPLVLALRIGDAVDPVDREERAARAATAEAAIRSLEGLQGSEVDSLRAEFEAERDLARDAQDGNGRPVLAGKEIRAAALAARREHLLVMRNEGTIGDDAFHRLEAEMDQIEMAIATRI